MDCSMATAGDCLPSGRTGAAGDGGCDGDGGAGLFPSCLIMTDDRENDKFVGSTRVDIAAPATTDIRLLRPDLIPFVGNMLPGDKSGEMGESAASGKSSTELGRRPNDALESEK